MGPDDTIGVIVIVGIVIYGLLQLRKPTRTLDTPGAGVYVRTKK